MELFVAIQGYFLILSTVKETIYSLEFNWLTR
jgi:hypothetical protein